MTSYYEGATEAGQEDAYPSRVYPEPRILERQDPVVYSEVNAAEDLPLSHEQIESYEKNGFLILENLFNEEEVQIFRDELERLREKYKATDEEGVIQEPDSGIVRSLFQVHQIGNIFPSVASDERILKKIEFLLNSQAYIHQSRINLKPGFHGKEFYWHSDFETWHVEDGMPRMRAISCSISLTENTEQNGPLLLVPGSHRKFIACVGKTPEDHYKQSLRRQEYGVPDEQSLTDLVDEGGLVSFTGKPGSVVLFESNTMHASNSNVSPHPRSNIFLVYNSVENRLVNPFGGVAPRPEYIATREGCKPLESAPVDYRNLS